MMEGNAVSNLHSCTILWSTQSGRAKACVRRVARILREQTLTVVTVGGEVDQYSFCERILEGTFPPYHWWLFVVSTTGDGEQCDCIQQTWKALLSKSLPHTLLDNHRFALFSLGDRAYGPQFCAAGRKLAARLVQLGAQPVCGIGYGDDGTPNGGVFADLDVWLNKTLFPLLPKKSISGADSIENEPKPAYNVIVQKALQRSYCSGSEEEWTQGSYKTEYQKFFAESCPLTAYTYRSQSEDKVPLVGHVVSNERITDSSWDQDTRHICIELSDARHRAPDSLPYQAGDIATIFPANSENDVAALLQVLTKSVRSMADTDIEIEMNGYAVGSTPWPRHCTLRGLLTYCADIKGLPEREDLRLLSSHCDSQHPMGKDQRDKLLSLSDPSGAALYTDYILREKRSWADVLYDFDSIQLTVDSLLTLLPTMRPRHFSIASAPSEGKNLEKGTFHVELCVAIVEGTTPLGRSYHGLCSKYLARLKDKALIRLWIRPGSFGKLPLQLNDSGRFDTPILCVGAGTGIAPLRSLILEREAIFKIESKCLVDSADQTPDNLLIFGCRKEGADFYYGETWKKLVTEKRLGLWTAFSRDQWHKIYVQQVLRGADNGKLVEKHILEHAGAIYVAGGAKMARAVKEEVLECLANVVGDKQAAMLLKRLNHQGRYNVEAWS